LLSGVPQFNWFVTGRELTVSQLCHGRIKAWEISRWYHSGLNFILEVRTWFGHMVTRCFSHLKRRTYLIRLN